MPVKPLPVPSEGVSEKLGNSIWVPCPACGTAFPVSPSMHGQRMVKLHCPACHEEFHPD
jgi:endogenous inhibitor of DNA gyrase (YacG/DUF329 family)